ncbi:TetR/AcrR family transcriptional regulator [Microbacterium sp. APC 3901]|uniref:TetR/AcrR family transcriptional regulator n=1 Tax=Microbacterium sp. APC 3901 TaxID=3035192 RepID=UPI0025B2CC8F|nr:TetR/AcrR family transcriptional regulator [Microbacterium sp. APC 3901]MDN3445460.1 TetR/AcrR family transcriptional regulator [Microbacterium sp. APC 3901]
MTVDPSTMHTRDRILQTALTMFGENPGAKLSVRAVAARTGVSTGSLRFHFPTQRALLDEVLRIVYEVIAPDDPIHDETLAPRERLLACLRQVLAPSGVGEQARHAATLLHQTFIEPELTGELRDAYLANERAGQRRVEHWLSVLGEEGSLPPGDDVRRARFLNTVLAGLALERALPSDESILTSETNTLTMAVDAVFTGASSPAAD